jgi:hypothetical protein
MKPGDEESSLLAEIVAQVIERRRRGEKPDIEEYQRKHPELAQEIEGQVRMIEVLEGDRRLEGPGSQPSLGEILAAQPLSVQRIVYLRNFEKRSWQEIAGALGQPEHELRRIYSHVLRELLDHFASGG